MNRKGIMVVEAVFIGLAVTLSAISLSPIVRTSFQKNRAIEMCEYDGGIHCEGVVNSMTKKSILKYIRDDGNKSFYAVKIKQKSGGELRARILNAQK